MYWEPAGHALSSTYKSIVNGYLQNAALASGQTTNVFSVATQYYQQGSASGAPLQHIDYAITAGAEVDDTNPYPAQGTPTGCVATTGFAADCVTDVDLQAELSGFLTARSFPIDDSHMYVVMLGSNVESCLGSGLASNSNECTSNAYCAYHSGFGPPYLIYSVQPYPSLANCTDPWNGPQGPNGDAVSDAQVSLLSHEVNEAITNWAGAWQDSNGYEDGDECAYVYGAPLGSTQGGATLYNQVIGNGKYYTQLEFSNADYAAGVGDPTTTGGTKVPGCVAQNKPVTCSAATLATSPSSPGAPGLAVQLAAGATCPGTPTYRFSIQPPGGVSAIAQDYSTSNAFTWQTAGLASGTYGIQVDARVQGSSSASEATASRAYLLQVVPCADVVTASPASPGGTGGAVTIAATSSGCGDPRYRFWMQAPGAAWKIVQDYSNGTSTYRWSGSSAAGPYRFEADVRDASHSAAYDAVANTTYQVAACSAAGLTPDAGAPQAPGTTIFMHSASTRRSAGTCSRWL